MITITASNDLEDVIENIFFECLLNKKVLLSSNPRLSEKGKHVIKDCEFKFISKTVSVGEEDAYYGEYDIPSYELQLLVETENGTNPRWIPVDIEFCEENYEISSDIPDDWFEGG